MVLKRKKPRDEAMEKIENYIIKNRLKPDDKLPSERTMCEMWDYNRSTLRSAIKQLMLEGKLYNKVGSGTYVAREKLIRDLKDAKSLKQAAEAAGRKITTEVIGVGFCETPKNIGKKLKLPLGHKLFCLARVRCLEGIPVMISNVYLDAVRFPGLERYDFRENSLYRILNENYGVEIAGGIEKLSISTCDEQEAAHLKVAVGTPVIYQSGITVDAEDVPFEYFKEITRSEYISFASELVRK